MQLHVGQDWMFFRVASKLISVMARCGPHQRSKAHNRVHLPCEASNLHGRDPSLACACEYNWKCIAHKNKNGLSGWKAKGCSKCLIHALGNVCRRMGMRRLSRSQLKREERRVAMGTRDIWTIHESLRQKKGLDMHVGSETRRISAQSRANVFIPRICKSN